MNPRDELAALALGQLAPREREALLARIRGDHALAREAEAVARHLALYRHLPEAPEPKPFAALAPRLGSQRGKGPPVFLVGCAASILLMLVSGLRTPAVPVPSSSPARWTAHAPTHAASKHTAPTERVLKAGRARVVLDAHAILHDEPGTAVMLEQGRAWFEIGPGPFTVRTARANVTVEGTAFEVEVGASLRVEVAEGRVRVGPRLVEAGFGLEGERLYPLGSRPGRFSRLADLTLGGLAVTPTGLALVVAFDNQADFARAVQGPEAAATGLLLAFEGPDGATHAQGVDILGAAGGRLPAAGRVRLGPGERMEIPLSVAHPPGPAGSWRLTALYRPQGEAPISSPPLSFEIPPR